jgi:hypothetical protein
MEFALAVGAADGVAVGVVGCEVGGGGYVLQAAGEEAGIGVLAPGVPADPLLDALVEAA